MTRRPRGQAARDPSATRREPSAAAREPSEGARGSHDPSWPGDAPWVMPAAWVVVAASAVTLLWLALSFHRVGDYLTESDFYGGYAAGAALIREGRLDPSRYQVVGPLFEAAVAAVGLVVRDLFTAAKLVSVAAACGTLAVWLLLLARRAGAAAALWSVLFLAVNPQFVRYGFSATTDMLATFLQGACLFLLLGARGRYAALGAGLIAGLAALTRYNAAVLLPAGLLLIAWPGVLAGRAAGSAATPALRPARGLAALLFIGGFALATAPWLAFSLSRGEVPGAMLARNFVYYATPDAARNIQDWPGDLTGPEVPTTSLRELLRRDAGALVSRALAAIPEHLAKDAEVLLGWPAAIVCLLGVPFVIRDPRMRPLLPLAIPGVALFLVLVPVFYSPRYSLPLAPLYLALAGAAIASPRLALGAGAARVPVLWLAALVPLVLTVQSNVRLQRLLESQTPVEVVDAGRALSKAAPKGARVVSRKGHIGYYSGLEVSPFPRVSTLKELADHARRSEAAFLYFSWLEVQLRPEFSYLLDTTSQVPGLAVVHATERNASVVYRIGEGFGQDPAWLATPLLTRVHWARVLTLALPPALAAPHRDKLAAYALDQGQPAEALRQAEQATAALPRDTLAWVLKGHALRQLGRPAEAAQAFEAALALDPREARAHIGLGWALLALGRNEEAAKAWRPAIGPAANDSTLGAMTILFEELGDQEAARAARTARAARAQPPR